MKVAVFDTHNYEKQTLLTAAKRQGFSLHFFEVRLNAETVKLASGFPAVCVFVNDRLSEEVLAELAGQGCQVIALRCAGFNNVDLKAAERHNLPLLRVTAYSPHAVAEFAVGLILTLNRKLHRAYHRVHDMDFRLDGLMGFDLYNKTVGVIGTGQIGKVFAQIMLGFGCHVVASDPDPDKDLIERGVNYVNLNDLFKTSDIISLHLPLNKNTQHIIDKEAIELMKPHVMLINTGRGGLIETRALIDALKANKIGSAGLDVYEEEEQVFFHDFSESIMPDDALARLITFPNVLVTSHQAFLTKEALTNIADTTIDNLSGFFAGKPLQNRVEISR